MPRRLDQTIAAPADGDAAPSVDPDGVARPAAATVSAPGGPRPLLTVGMAVADDYDGAFFTLTSLRLHHPETHGRIRFLIIDNRPDGPGAHALTELCDSTPDARYIPVGDVQGTAVRDRVFREADTEWVMCLDSHVLLAPGALDQVLTYCADHPDSADLLQGPLVHPDLQHAATHWDPVWRRGMYGIWGTDPRGQDPKGAPFEILMQGLGVFACRRAVWPGLNPRFHGHGGEEGYLHHKVRAAGGRVLCLPFLRWAHRFNPAGHANVPADHTTAYTRLRNYLLGWHELGRDTAPVLDHFTELHGPDEVAAWTTRYERERASPFSRFDAIYCINSDQQPERWQRIHARLERLGIAHQLRRLPAVHTPDNHHVGCALSHRQAIQHAYDQGLNNVLVLEDDAVFLDGTEWILARSLDELARQPGGWDLYYLGAWYYSSPLWQAHLLPGHLPRQRPVPGCTHLATAPGSTLAHALAYHQRAFQALLDELPADEHTMRAWIEENTAIDQYYATAYTGRTYRCEPPVASQENLRLFEHPDLQRHYH